MKYLDDLRFLSRFWVGKYPLIFKFIVGLIRGHNRNIAQIKTDIVIEGYPRSANTYAVAAVRYLNGDSYLIASHQHSISQIKLAKKYNLPIIVLIRKPQEAILSLSIRRPNVSIRHLITEYIYFYSKILKLKDFIVIAKFEDVIHDYNKIICITEKKYSIKIGTLTGNDNEEKHIFSIIDEMEQIDSGGVMRMTHVARPVNSIEKEGVKLKKLKEFSKYQTNLLLEAEKIYLKVVDDV